MLADEGRSRHGGPGVVILEQLAVLPDDQRQGYGGALVSRHRNQRVIVGSSDMAVPFYEKHDFRKVGKVSIPGYEEWWLERQVDQQQRTQSL